MIAQERMRGICQDSTVRKMVSDLFQDTADMGEETTRILT